MRKKNLDHARKLDVWMRSDKPAIKLTADFIFGLMKRKCDCKTDKDGKLRILRNGKDSLSGARVLEKLKSILTDLYVANRQDNMLYIAFSRSKNDYRAHRRFKQIFLALDYVVFITDFLTEHKFIEFHPGIRCRDLKNYSRYSRMKAAKKLVRKFRENEKKGGKIERIVFPVILRDEDKNSIYFPIDNVKTKTIIKNVNKINRLIKRHSYEIPDLELIFNEELKKDYDAHNNGFQQTYQRIFNNSSLAFDQGGRWYGIWPQHIKKEYRKYIEIDGEHTVELDYSCLHLSMLYALKGIPKPKGDLYALSGISEEYRPVIKKCVNISLNAPDESSAIKALAKHTRDFYRKTGLPYLHGKDLIAAIRLAHEPIKDEFCSGLGVYLQNYDSQIAEKIFLHFEKKDVLVLGIHDSFIIDFHYATELEEVMKREFASMFNADIEVKAKETLYDYAQQEQDELENAADEPLSWWEEVWIDKFAPRGAF